MRKDFPAGFRPYLLLVVALLYPVQSLAGMGNIATTYGVLPSDLGTAQALSMFNPQVSATYYNPAYLMAKPGGELTAGLFHAEHELRVDSQGGDNPPDRDGDVIQNTPSQHVLLGMKTDLSSLTVWEHPIQFGVMLGVEKYGGEMLAFESKTSREGQFLRFGRQPLFLNLGGATRIWRGIDAGLSARVTLHSDATLVTESTLGGETDFEQLEVEAEPDIRPILGVNINWGETFCQVEDCWLENLETGLVWRTASNTQTAVTSEVVIPGTIDDTDPLRLSILTLDSWQPDIFALGTRYQWGPFNIGATVEYQKWSDLGRELRDDDVKNQANLEFNDIVVPRVGTIYRVNEIFSVRAGLAWEESPLDSKESMDVNYFDNDRIVFGLGGTAELENFPGLAYPVRLDIGYQYHHLRDRDFDLTHQDHEDGEEPFETVTTDGDVHVLSGSITLRF